MDSSAYPENGRGRARRHAPAAGTAAGESVPCGARRSPLATALTLALSLAAGPAAAAGLGRIELDSGLNERLDARIPLYNASEYPPGSIEVGLASPERFRAAEFERPHALTGLRFELEPAPSGNGHVIRVRSPNAIVEPFLRFLVAVDLPDGRIVRAYTVLLDPPSFAVDPDPVAQSVPAAAGTASGGGSADAVAGTSRAGPSATATAAADTRPERYGPVPRGSSAWRVAERVQPPGASIYQTMVALRRANPGAFRDGDLGQLREGVLLEVPAPAEIAAIPQARAVGIYRQYLADNGDAGTAAALATESTEAGGAATGMGAEAGGDRAEADTAPPEPAATATVETAATASTADTNPSAGSTASAAAAGAGRAPAPGPRLDAVRTDIAGLEATIAGLRARVDGGLTDQAEGIEQLRAALANVRGELATLRETRSEPAPAGGTPLWVTGLIALLASGLGALLGFARGRRAVSPDAPAAATASAAGAADEPGEQAPPLTDDAVATAAEADDEPAAVATVAATAPDAGGDAAAATDEAGQARDRDESDRAEPEFVPGPDPGRARESEPEPKPEPGTGAADWIDPEGVTADEPDSYQSLADLCLEAGWARDAEGVLRDAIEQRGDDPGYRAGILAALHHEGAAEEFREEFERYRAVAADDDRAWPSVLQMGRELLPGDPAFGDAVSAGAAPAAGESADEILELDEFGDDFEDDFDPGALDDLDDPETAGMPAPEAGPADDLEPPADVAAPDPGPATGADESPVEAVEPAEEAGEPEFELALDPEPAGPRLEAEDAAADEEWPELDLDEPAADEEQDDTVAVAGAGDAPDPGRATVPFPGPAPDAAGDADDPTAPLPTLDAGGEGDSAAAAPEGRPAVAEGDNGDFHLSLARVYLKAGWARDAEAVLREAIAQRGDEPAYRARLLEALFQAEARNEFLEAFDEYRAIAAEDDPDWDEVRRMGRSLWPTHEAFAEPAPGADQPAPATEAGGREADAPEADAERPRKRRRA